MAKIDRKTHVVPNQCDGPYRVVLKIAETLVIMRCVECGADVMVFVPVSK